MISVRYPSLRVRFSVGGLNGEESAILDTGFSGDFAIPARLSASLPLLWMTIRIETVTGQDLRMPVFPGIIELIEQPGPFRAQVIAVGTHFLLGLQALNRFKVTFDHGQRVIVEP